MDMIRKTYAAVVAGYSSDEESQKSNFERFQTETEDEALEIAIARSVKEDAEDTPSEDEFLTQTPGFNSKADYEDTSEDDELLRLNSEGGSKRERSQSPEIVFVKEEKKFGGKSERACSQLSDSTDDDDDYNSHGLSSKSGFTNPFIGGEPMYFGEDPATPYLFKGKYTLSFEQKLHILVLDVNHNKVCSKRPNNVQENSFFVIDRSKLKIEIENRGRHVICAHTIAVAHYVGKLSHFLDSYKPPLDRMVRYSIPSGSGMKANDKKRKRVRTVDKQPRDVGTYGDRVQVNSELSSEDEPYELLMVKDTSATTCYGCKGRVRDKPSSQPPPAPYDVFIMHRERRVFKKRGEIKVRITTEPERVYFHPTEACCADLTKSDVRAGKLIISDEVLGWLKESHKRLLFNEFGMIFD